MTEDANSQMLARRSVTALALVAAATLMIGSAGAATFTATELSYDRALLNQFNLVTIGNYTTTNETEGRIIVGGNATINGSRNVCFNGCAGNATAAVDASGATFGALTVFGNLAGGVTTTKGNINVGGNSTASVNLRSAGSFNIVGSAANSTVDSATVVRTTRSTYAGAIQNSGNNNKAQLNQTMATVFPFSTAPMTNVQNLAQGIAALPGSPGVNAKALPKQDNLFFTATNDYTAGGKKYGVITTTLANLAAETNFRGIDNGTNDATFVIVTGDGANFTLPNLNSYAGANKVIFDFVDATTLKFAGTWNGTILAPLATITQQGGVLDGSVVVSSITQTQELHQINLFTGDLSGLTGFTYGARVPEPASFALFALGLFAVCLARRRSPGGGHARASGSFLLTIRSRSGR